ncbi:hypothetical protein SAMN05216275_15059, partial [Streptosporangium canum]
QEQAVIYSPFGIFLLLVFVAAVVIPGVIAVALIRLFRS